MELQKMGIALLVLLLTGIAILPTVGAVDTAQKSVDNNTVVTLFAPIDKEIWDTMNVAVTSGKTGSAAGILTENTEKLVQKYQNNLNLILDSLEKQTGSKLSAADRENLKRIIINEHMGRVSWDLTKKKMGISDADLKTVDVNDSNSRKLADGSLMAYMPNSLILKQVSADVNGGIGVDGGWIPYIVNGGNQLYRVDWNSGSGYTLYQCRFRDEDVPSSYAADAAYDTLRLQIYHTLEDTQGFFIYTNNHIEFGNDYDNGHSYGTVVGQHGYAYLPWSTGTPVYVSNVWNHAMSTTDKNSNMAKVTYNY